MPGMIQVFAGSTSHGFCHLLAYKVLNLNAEVSNLGRELHCAPFTAQDSLVSPADMEDSDQTGHMPSLIRFLA